MTRDGLPSRSLALPLRDLEDDVRCEDERELPHVHRQRFDGLEHGDDYEMRALLRFSDLTSTSARYLTIVAEEPSSLGVGITADRSAE